MTTRDQQRFLMPLCDTAGGAVVPLVDRPGALRPWCARRAVRPLQAGRHDTTATRWRETKATQQSDDGRVVPDSISIPHTDS